MHHLARIATTSGPQLCIRTETTDAFCTIEIHLDTTRQCILHWGLTHTPEGPWHMPPPSVWPEGSAAFGSSAVQTPFRSVHDGQRGIHIKLDRDPGFSYLAFALFFRDEHRWDNNSGRNYHIPLHEAARPAVAIDQVLKDRIQAHKVAFERVYHVNAQEHVAAAVMRSEDWIRVVLISDIPAPLVLHWGIPQRPGGPWEQPDPHLWPPHTIEAPGNALQTPLDTKDGVSELTLTFRPGTEPPAIAFVLKDLHTNRWIKDQGRDFLLMVGMVAQEGSISTNPVVVDLAEEILQRELSGGSWSLMHRYNLCFEIVERVKNDEHGLALLFVWLRFSALRQLDWQRNYNTKPRELSHSLDRLVRRLSDIYASVWPSRQWVRLMLTTLGRGGQGQRIRDEILEIMHRHHIKEASGTFLEEWHQKIHNNTTPDDVVICQAYLAFLKADGDLQTFYNTLNNGGVTKERLASFDRPLKTPPDFVPHLKEALISDFSHFLTTLKAVHEGTDLDTSVNAVRGLVDQETQQRLDWLCKEQVHTQASALQMVREALTARRHLHSLLAQSHIEPSVLFLDLALEVLVRTVVERTIHTEMPCEELVELFGGGIENWLLSCNDLSVLPILHRHWNRLIACPGRNEQWALQARAILDRVTYVISEFARDYQEMIQPKALFLGRNLLVAEYILATFTEEVLRGSPAFVVSLLQKKLDPLLRRISLSGAWQVISPGRISGRLEVLKTLPPESGPAPQGPSIIVAETLKGEENISPCVVGVITGQPIDVLSHLAIRARNAGTLLAVCYDQRILNELRSLDGHLVQVATTAPDTVQYSTVDAEVTPASPSTLASVSPGPRPPLEPVAPWDSYAIGFDQFRQGLVGNKSLNLRRLRHAVPEWIRIPSSIALPFGTCERILNEKQNRSLRDRYHYLIAQLDAGDVEVITRIRELILLLEAPPELPGVIEKTMIAEGLGWPDKWPQMWQSIKTVWASKWNTRAYYSRKIAGVPHHALFMAVLIQQTIDADYSFVIHTVNPVSGNQTELYTEIVVGLGETLTGSYPGRALSVIIPKDYPKGSTPQIVSFLSKHIGLFGGGLIFRSDSNGEDLSTWAGAGLYESVMLQAPHTALVDYTDHPLLWDENVQHEVFRTIAQIGRYIEDFFHYPQDIEGAIQRGTYWVVQSRPQVGHT